MLAVATALDAKELDLHGTSLAIKQHTGKGPLEIHNAAHLHGALAGLKSGEYVVVGDAGDYFGVLTDGATVRVKGNAGKYVADNMTRGTVIVEGSADYGAGLYPYGGTLVVLGDAGDFTATMNKGATIIVGGNVGAECGTYHLAGDFVVVGNAGLNFGNYLIRGTLYLGGEAESYGRNTCLEPMQPEDIDKLRRWFEQYGIQADPAKFKKLVAKSTKPFYE